MSGRHRKPCPIPLKIKAVGGIVTGAALAGTIAATAATATANTTTVSAAASLPVSAGATSARTAQHKIIADATTVRRQAQPQRPKEQPKPQAKPQPKQPAKDKAPKRSKPAAPKKVTADQVIKLAKSQLGVREDGSGETKFNKWFMSDSRALGPLRRDGGDLGGYKDAAWCSMFISWIGNSLGISGQMGFDAWTPKHAEWFKQRGRWGTTPRPGAVTFFSWGGGNDVYDIDHVGLTIKDNGDGTIKTIEGNTDDRVAIRERDRSDVLGYGYPDYAK